MKATKGFQAKNFELEAYNNGGDEEKKSMEKEMWWWQLKLEGENRKKMLSSQLRWVSLLQKFYGLSRVHLFTPPEMWLISGHLPWLLS